MVNLQKLSQRKKVMGKQKGVAGSKSSNAFLVFLIRKAVALFAELIFIDWLR